jgi:uncharacterized membrane protein
MLCGRLHRSLSCALVFLVAVFAVPASAFSAADYTYTRFDFPGAFSTSPFDINNAGHIVGQFAVFVGEQGRGFYYNGSEFIEIQIPGAISITANAINNHDEVVGTYRDSASQLHGFIYRNGQVTTYDAPVADATQTSLTGINDAGELTGYYVVADGNTVGFIDALGFVMTIPGSFVLPLRINNQGQIVGVYRPGTDTNRGFLYDSGTFTTVPPPGTIESVAWGINERGDVVGDYWPNGTRLGYLYDGKRVISFDYPGGEDTHGTALFGINDPGVMVGGYFTQAGTRGFIVRKERGGSGGHPR